METTTLPTYLELINQIRSNALHEIQTKVGRKKVSLRQDENDDEEIYNLPIVSTTGRHGDYMEFAIVAISKKNVYCVGKGDYDDQEETFSWDDVDTNNIAIIADSL